MLLLINNIKKSLKFERFFFLTPHFFKLLKKTIITPYIAFAPRD